MPCTYLCFLQSPEPFLSELAAQGMADACFPEPGRSRGLGQVLAARDQMSRIIEQLVSGKVRVVPGTGFCMFKGVGEGVPCGTGKNLVRSDPCQDIQGPWQEASMLCMSSQIRLVAPLRGARIRYIRLGIAVRKSV